MIKMCKINKLQSLVYGLILFVTIFVCGCATGQLAWTSEQREAIMTRTYNHSYDKVFSTILNMLKSKGTPIASVDKENGIINTDYMSAGAVVWGSAKQKLNINIAKTGASSTKVSLYIHVEGYSDTLGMPMTDDAISEEHYKQVFDRITEELK